MLGGFFSVLLQACSPVPIQSGALLSNPPPDIRPAHELEQVSFNPQRDYQCGPAALATVLQWNGLDITPDTLVPEIYLPGRKGSLQVEVIAAIRRHDQVPYKLDKSMTALLREIQAGNPVLVLQNLGLESIPAWHFAVVVGYDLEADRIVLRSGETRRRINSLELFERTWQRADYWALVVLPPTRLPATANPDTYLASVAPFEELGKPALALSAYHTALQRWPTDRNLLMAAGNASYRLQAYPAAETYYRKVLQTTPDHVPALNNLAYVMLKQGRYPEAEELAKQAVQASGGKDQNALDTLQEIQALREAVKQE